MDTQTVAERVLLKEQATTWVDRFWEKCNSPLTEAQQGHLELMSSLPDHLDEEPVEEHTFDKAYSAEYFFYVRFKLFDIQLTTKALGFLSCFAKLAGDVALYTAAIAHSFLPVDIENKKLITYHWLSTSLFHNTIVSREDLQELWDEQKLENGKYLVNEILAFQFASADELNYVEHVEVAG